MADELEPVEQKFLADLADYVEPIQGAADDTEAFAETVRQAGDDLRSLKDQAAEAADSVEALGVAEDGADGSAEAFAEAEDHLRDSIAEADHELHDQTESFFAWAAAADAAAAEAETFRDLVDRTDVNPDGLYGTLKKLRDLMADGELGQGFLLLKNGVNSYGFASDDAKEATKAFEITEQDLRNTTRDADQMFLAAKQSIDGFSTSAGKGKSGADGLGRSIDKLRNDIARMEMGPNLAKIMDDVLGDLEGGSGNGGILGKLLMFMGGGKNGGGFSFGNVFGNIASLATGMLVVAPLIAAIIQEIGAVISGFAAAGAGALAFGILAGPAIKKVFDVLTGTDPLKSLNAEQKQLYDGIEGLIREYDKLAKAFAPSAEKTFGLFLGDLNKFLPVLGPQATAFADAMDPLLRELGRFETSKGFQDWLKKADTYIGPAVTAIGKGVGSFAVAIGQLMTSLSSKDVAHAINIFFGTLTGIVKAITYVAQHYAKSWDQMQSDTLHAYHTIDNDVIQPLERQYHGLSDANAQLSTDIGHWWDDIANTIIHAYSTIEAFIHSTINRIRADWDTGWNDIVSFAESIPGRIMHALSDLPGLMLAAGEDMIRMLIHGIENEIPGLSSIVSHIEGILGHIGGLFHDIGSLGSAAGALVTGGGGGGGGGGSVSHSVNVDVSGIMTHPAFAQALQRHVQTAVLNAARDNQGSMLVLPGRRS